MSCTDVFNKKLTAFADELVIKEATMRRFYVSHFSFSFSPEEARHLRRWDQSAVNILYLR